MTRSLRIICLTLMLCLVAPLVRAGDSRKERTMRAVRIQEKITVDGELDEPGWNSAEPATDFIQRLPFTGEPATERTEVRLLYGDESLYVGAYCFDSAGDKGIVVKDIKRDFNTLQSDGFQFVIDTFHYHRNSYRLGLDVQPVYQFSAGATWTYNDVNLPAGAFRTSVLGTRMRYSFTTNLFLNALIQYDSDTREVISNIRLNFIYKPLSDFYLVYNERRSALGEVVERALIAKLTHAFTF